MARHKVWQNSGVTTFFKSITESYLRCYSASTVLKDMGSCCMLSHTSQGEKYLKSQSNKHITKIKYQ